MAFDESLNPNPLFGENNTIDLNTRYGRRLVKRLMKANGMSWSDRRAAVNMARATQNANGQTFKYGDFNLTKDLGDAVLRFGYNFTPAGTTPVLGGRKLF